MFIAPVSGCGFFTSSRSKPCPESSAAFNRARHATSAATDSSTGVPSTGVIAAGAFLFSVTSVNEKRSRLDRTEVSDFSGPTSFAFAHCTPSSTSLAMRSSTSARCASVSSADQESLCDLTPANEGFRSWTVARRRCRVLSMYEKSSARRCCILAHLLLDDREYLGHDCLAAISRIPRPYMTIPVGLGEREAFTHDPALELIGTRPPPSD